MRLIPRFRDVDGTPLPRRITWCLLAITGSTLLALLQASVGFNLTHEGSWWAWWLNPIHVYANAERPLISADLRAVAAVRSGSQTLVWVGGNEGVLAFSSDHGQTWEQSRPVDFHSQVKDIVGLSFRDAKHGWLVTREDRTFDTDDGGHTWTERRFWQHNITSGSMRPNRASGVQDDLHSIVTVQHDVLTRTSQLDRREAVRFDKIHIPGVYRVLLLSPGVADAVGDGGRIWHLHETDGVVKGEEEAIPSNPYSRFAGPIDLRGIFEGNGNVWVCGTNGHIYLLRPTPTSRTWDDEGVIASNALNDIVFTDDQEGWAVGDRGTIAHTTDSGHTWSEQTQGSLTQLPRTRVAPWYYLTWVLSLVPLAWPFRALVRRDSNTPFLLPDEPVSCWEDDAVPFERIVQLLAETLTSGSAPPPQTIVLTGESGSGKTTMLRLVQGACKREGAITVWCDPSQIRDDDDVFASVLSAIRSQATPSIWSADGVGFYLNLIHRRAGSLLLSGMFAAVGIAVILGAFLRESSTHVSLLSLISGISWATYLKAKALPMPGGKIWGAIKQRREKEQARWSIRNQVGDRFRHFREALGRPLLILVDGFDASSGSVELLDVLRFLSNRAPFFIIMTIDPSILRGSEKQGNHDDGLDACAVVPQSSDLDAKCRDSLDQFVSLKLSIPRPARDAVVALSDQFYKPSRQSAPKHRRVMDYVLAALTLLALLSIAVEVGRALESRLHLLESTEKILRTAAISRNSKSGTGPENAPSLAGNARPIEASGKLSSFPRVQGADEKQPIVPVLHPGQTGKVSAPKRATTLPWQAILGLFVVGSILVRSRNRGVLLPLSAGRTSLDAAIERFAPIILVACDTPRKIKRMINRIRLMSKIAAQSGDCIVPDHALIALVACEQLNCERRANACAEIRKLLLASGVSDECLGLYAEPFQKLAHQVPFTCEMVQPGKPTGV